MPAAVTTPAMRPRPAIHGTDGLGDRGVVGHVARVRARVPAVVAHHRGGRLGVVRVPVEHTDGGALSRRPRAQCSRPPRSRSRRP